MNFSLSYKKTTNLSSNFNYIWTCFGLIKKSPTFSWFHICLQTLSPKSSLVKWHFHIIALVFFSNFISKKTSFENEFSCQLKRYLIEFEIWVQIVAIRVDVLQLLLLLRKSSFYFTQGSLILRLVFSLSSSGVFHRLEKSHSRHSARALE